VKAIRGSESILSQAATFSMIRKGIQEPRIQRETTSQPKGYSWKIISGDHFKRDHEEWRRKITRMFDSGTEFRTISLSGAGY